MASGCSESWSTAKRSVLKSPELMAMTFSHLKITSLESLEPEDYCYSFNEQLRDFLNAALTCRDFLDVGLDALWEELDSLMPLLQLLPALEIEDDTYVRANVHWHFLYDLILFLGP
jgi:hypothetical protein